MKPLIVFLAVTATAVTVAGCKPGEQSAQTPQQGAETATSGTPAPEPADWVSVGSGEGNALRIETGETGFKINLFCPGWDDNVIVTLADMQKGAADTAATITLGTGEKTIELSVKAEDNENRPGVTGRTAYSGEFAKMLAEPFVARYGNQTVGPITPPDAEEIAEFAAGCSG